MNKFLFYSFLFAISLLLNTSYAQTVHTGRESMKTEMNFTTLAHYYSLHPEPLVLREVQNEEEEERPRHTTISDPSLIHGRVSGPRSYGPVTSYLPISTAPTDTFQATLDNGTAIPPDTHGAVDSNYCMTTINTSVRIQTRAGAVLSTVSLNSFWSSLVSGGTFDPRVHYDPYYARWTVVTVAGGHDTSSCILIAVSQTSNPTGAWWMYKVRLASATHWIDYPNVGFNKKWVVITGNLFPISSGSYAGCRVYAFNYADLMSGAGAPFTSFTHATSGTIQPTATYSATLENIFAVESWNGSTGGGGTLKMWKITGAVGAESMTTIGFPAATGINWQNDGDGGNDFAPQLGTTNLIQTNDDRIFSAVFMNNRIWTTHSVFLPATGAPNRSSVLWWEIDTFGTPMQTGLIDDPSATNFLGFPSIAVNSSNDALIGFSQFAATTYPNAAYALRMHTDPVDSTRPWVVYRHGLDDYYKIFSGTDNRWGDYSNTMIDPLNFNDFWTIQEASSTSNRWDTWWAHVSMCNITATVTPATSAAFCAGGSVVLNGTTGAGYTYQWQLGGSPIAGATNSSYIASIGGTYAVVITNSTCSATSPALVVTVNPLPGAITGARTACPGTTTTLSSAGGGTWTSGTTSVATVNSTSGVVTGVGLGIATITYTLPTGCSATAVVTINPAPTASITAGGPTTFCTGGSVALNANPGTGFTYQWRTSGGPIAGATNITYTATAAGTYSVTVTNSSGCSATSSGTTVSVTPGPGATITPAGPTTFCSPGSVVLNANTGAGITYQWQVGGVNIPGATASSFTASTAGNYTVIVTFGACVVTSAPTTVTVLSATPGPITGPTAVCIGQTITLANTVPSGTWSSSNPSVGVINSLGVVTGLATGVTIITYSVTNICGTGFTTLNVTVSPGMAISPITGTLNVCTGGTTTLSNATPGGTWSSSSTAIATIGSTTGIAAGVSIGMATITYSVSTSGCISRSFATLNVTSPHTAVLSAMGPTTFCTGASVTLSVPTGPGYTFVWKRNGITISGAISSTYLATTSGNYTVVVTYPGGCNSTSAPVTVTVLSTSIFTPVVSVSASPGVVFCMSTTPTTFTAAPVGMGTPTSYQWYVNTTAVGTGPTYTYTPVAGDVVKVRMTVSDVCAFPTFAERSETIVVSPRVTPSVAVVPDKTALCRDSTIVFSPVPTYGGTAPNYVWYVNGIFVGPGATYSYAPSNGDVITVLMTSNYVCLDTPKATGTYTATVQPVLPNTVTIFATKLAFAIGTADTFVAIAPNAGSAPAYQWRVNGFAIGGATNSMYITTALPDSAIVSCEVTSSLPCVYPRTVHSAGIQVSVWSLGMETDPYTGNKFTLVPNPSRGEFTIEGSMISMGDANVNIVIMNTLGQTIYNEDAEAANGKVNKRVVLNSGIANGTYLVLITVGSEHMMYHVVVNK
ncbi:MAG: hypothetical protein K0Q79_1682 [Flavipsychrobacter sp.]|jgi:hypothetical protein|nr:hypothetical protein [Flavipsychrobacter sp.]